MVEKKHPNHSQRIATVMISALILAGTIFLNLFVFIGEPVFSDTIGILLGGFVISSDDAVGTGVEWNEEAVSRFSA